jgi:hypothetical protein
MWKFVVVELYCGIYLDYYSKSEKYHFRLEPEKGFCDNPKKVENPDYDPTFPRPTPPAFCKKMVGVDCLKNNCVHVVYSDGWREPEDPENMSG